MRRTRRRRAAAASQKKATKKPATQPPTEKAPIEVVVELEDTSTRKKEAQVVNVGVDADVDADTDAGTTDDDSAASSGAKDEVGTIDALDVLEADGVSEEEEERLRQLAKERGISHWWTKSVERLMEELRDEK